MNNSEHRKLWLFSAVISLSIAAAAFGSVPLAAQVSTAIQGTGCLERKTLLVSFNQAGNIDIVASVLPSATNFFIDMETQTLTGRLRCADPTPAFYNCGHTKQSVWGCKPDCFIEPDGSQYILQSAGRLYSVTGNPSQIRPFLTDQVAVTGELKGGTIKAVSITKTSKKARTIVMRPENGTP